MRWISSIDVAMPPVSPSRRRCFAPPVIRVDDALCGATLRHCTVAARYRRTQSNSRSSPGRFASRPDRPGLKSGPERAPRSRPSRSSKSPKPECASEPLSRYAANQHMQPTPPQDKRPLVPFPVNSRSRVGAAGRRAPRMVQPPMWTTHRGSKP